MALSRIRVRRRSLSRASALCAVLGLAATAHAEGASLLAVSTPAGSGEAARIARRLLPDPDVAPGRMLFDAQLHRPLAAAKGTDAGAPTDAGVESEMSGLSDIAEKAREAALAFDLVTAAELWRKEVDALLRSEQVLTAPERVAEAALEAGAASLAAGERNLALTYFRKAIAVFGDVRPGAAIPPDAKSLFETAEEMGPVLLDTLKDDVLAAICEAAGADGLVWVAAGRDGEEWAVSFKIYMKGDAATELETRHHKTPFDDARIEGEQQRLLGIVSRRLMMGDHLLRPSVTVSLEHISIGKPWHRKWWVYLLGGAVVAGAGAGIAAWMVLSPREATVTAHF